MKDSAMLIFIKEMEDRLAVFRARRLETRWFSAERKRLTGKIKELESLIWLAHKNRRTVEAEQLEKAYLKGRSDQFHDRSGKFLNIMGATADAAEWRIETFGK
jgi:hypothetical protein